MSAPTLAELQAVSLGAWLGLVGMAYESGCRISELSAAEDAGLVEFPKGRAPFVTPKGTRYLAALRAIREGLSDEHIRHIRGEDPLFSAVASGLESRGLLRITVTVADGRYGTEATDLGRAALLLLEREDGEG